MPSTIHYQLSCFPENPVILQAPVYVHEGDTVPLRCHSRSGYSTDQTKFYKNGIMVLASAADPNLLEDNTKSNATYACSMPVIRTYRGSDKIEIFPAPLGVPSNRMITFMPNRNRLFKGESITMACNMGNLYASYVWIKDDWEVHRGMYYTIASAQVDHSGIYYCVQTDWLGVPIKRETAILEVINGLVIIQPLLHEDGRSYSLKCYNSPEYSLQSTQFYKCSENICVFWDNDVIDSWNAPGEYRCDSELYRNEYVTTDLVSLHVRELFSQPELKLSHNPAVEGDHMTLTCDTSPSRHRQRTELQFAFYKDGQDIPRYGSSNQYGVQSAQLKDSGNYFCEVKTSTTNVLKRSPMLHIKIQGK
ncbi:high affinity immunoglobulin gamma Fc receptor I-like [Rana temporaria]|uniref:high affinity immunoglobulin gamma Fc receptor I-like n=1 Tax=Rana temporaria TaxID=8407 RepID=UPI001AAC9091|nr:high affinity immunoglobulin gamma Fc receptor I-like [Rana temporaria]